MDRWKRLEGRARIVHALQPPGASLHQPDGGASEALCMAAQEAL